VAQDEFGFGEIESRGHFEKTDRNLFDGQDLDVPTYLRKGIKSVSLCKQARMSVISEPLWHTPASFCNDHPIVSTVGLMCITKPPSRRVPATAAAAASSFRREKYEPWGGPNGGDGGRGGDVILLGDDDRTTSSTYKYQPHWRGERGEHGQGADCTAARASPASSAAARHRRDRLATGEKVVAEIIADGEEIVLCKGGKGGWGNTHFKSSTSPAPRKRGTRASEGEIGSTGSC
jgi:hypothetical protein